MSQQVMRLSLYFILTCIIAFTLYYFPDIDIFISSQFYDESGGFHMGALPAIDFINKYITKIVAFMILSWAAIFSVRKFMSVRSIDFRHYIKVIYVLCVFIVGAGIIVNAVCKNWIFGRARPENVEIFCGDKKFQPPLKIGNECQSNCSFASGHSAMGFGIVAISYIASKRYRKYWLYSALFLGFGIGFVRIISGKHFFSDVVFAGIIMFWTAYIIAYIFRKNNILLADEI